MAAQPEHRKKGNTYYTTKEIAQALGLSEYQVIAIEKQAFEKLAKLLDRDMLDIF